MLTSEFPIARDGKCTGNTLWASLWSKTTPYAGHPHTKSNANPPSPDHSSCNHLVLHKQHSHLTWPRPPNLYWSWHFQQVDDPMPFSLCFASVSQQVFSDPEQCLPHDGKFWCHCLDPCCSVLGTCFQNRTWN